MKWGDNTDSGGKAVIYGGVGHHIQDLGDDNLVTFFKVRVRIAFAAVFCR